MLRSTFLHLVRGVDAEREAELWRKGILSWEDFENRNPTRETILAKHTLSPFSAPRAALSAGDIGFFAKALHRREHFRIALEVPKKTLFLDIETTGLSRYYDVITMIGWCYQGRYQAVVRGQSENALRTVLRDAQVLITFNGSLFDLPFLRTAFTDLRLPPVHVDLRFLAKRVGLSGGQKAIENILAYKRKGAASDIRGEIAPVLWHRYRQGDQDALKLLIEYNHCDVEGMKYIFDKVVSRLLVEKGVPKRVRDQIPVFAKSSELKFLNGEKHTGARPGAVRIEPYRGLSGPAIRLAELVPQSGPDAIRIVGIDLTGSAARPTGWCLLEGNQATTCCIRTDEDIVAATLETRPHIVSIDSPLSLPSGRISPFDDDPGREKFGIMRYCERMLKKRGINVYPALIPSMQKLTDRGIRLAAEFRSRGIPVIESYPGAAQDIMGIPRKRASLEMLRGGLNDFGVTGEFRGRHVTHDELDAITASIVGAFFWGGRFEALGAEDDEALIIPDLSRDPQSWLHRRVVGLSGSIAAGKTTAARYLEDLGFKYARYSMVIESKLREKGDIPSRSRLQEFGAEVHERFGQRWLGIRLIELLPSDGNLVIDGLRFPDDHAFLIECFGPAFRHIHVVSAEEIRQPRFASREGGGPSFAEAEAHSVESHAQELRDLAHAEICNETSLEAFQAQVRSFALN